MPRVGVDNKTWDLGLPVDDYKSENADIRFCSPDLMGAIRLKKSNSPSQAGLAL